LFDFAAHATQTSLGGAAKQAATANGRELKRMKKIFQRIKKRPTDKNIRWS
jgi:hypothetical protein